MNSLTEKPGAYADAELVIPSEAFPLQTTIQPIIFVAADLAKLDEKINCGTEKALSRGNYLHIGPRMVLDEATNEYQTVDFTRAFVEAIIVGAGRLIRDITVGSRGCRINNNILKI